MQTNSITLRSGDTNRLPTYLAAALLGALLVWTYVDAIQGLWNRWSTDAAYGHGFFVPLFALYLLWHRRKYFQPPFTGSWWGVLGILVAFALKLTGEYWYFALLEPFSIVPMAAGLGLLLLGWRGLLWYGPSAMFLAFMVPLPGRVADLMSQPLQRIATIAGTYLVQLVGIPAVAEGNVIVLTHANIGVIEACNGLRMLIQFIAVATAIAILIDRPFWCRCIVLASAVPVALAANILRITSTALAYEYATADFAASYFHGFAGWLMMPLGILLLYLELVFLDRAFPKKETDRPLAVS